MKFTITDTKAVTSCGSTTCTISQVVTEGSAVEKGRRRGIAIEEEKADGAWEGVLFLLDESHRLCEVNIFEDQ